MDASLLALAKSIFSRQRAEKQTNKDGEITSTEVRMCSLLFKLGIILNK